MDGPDKKDSDWTDRFVMLRYMCMWVCVCVCVCVGGSWLNKTGFPKVWDWLKGMGMPDDMVS